MVEGLHRSTSSYCVPSFADEFEKKIAIDYQSNIIGLVARIKSFFLYTPPKELAEGDHLSSLSDIISSLVRCCDIFEEYRNYIISTFTKTTMLPGEPKSKSCFKSEIKRSLAFFSVVDDVFKPISQLFGPLNTQHRYQSMYDDVSKELSFLMYRYAEVRDVQIDAMVDDAYDAMLFSLYSGAISKSSGAT